jgi:sporulation protein YlmC with PRC-barrel domain
MESMQFTIGAEATCTDGVCGELIRVVVDPIARAVTHVVVEPKHRSGLGKLVPLDLVESTTGGLHLRCSTADLHALEPAETTQFLPGVEGYPGYAEEEVLAWPYYGGNASVPVTFDTLPVDEVAVRRGDRVHATDGRIGHVEGLVVDAATRHVTHVLLQEGHLWGRKEVAIPIASVASVDDDGIRLTITKQEVEDLPAVADEQLHRL